MLKPLPEERTLLEQLAEGSEAAFNKVYRHFSPAIFNTIMLYVKYEEQADDLLQMVFVRIWEKRTELVSVKSMENFLFILTRNIVFNHLKKAALNRRFLLNAQELTSSSILPVDSLAEEREFNFLFRKALQQLPERQKQVYLLVTQENLSYEEVAKLLHLSRLTVKKHLELARRFVRSYMNRHLQMLLVILTFLFGKS